jgi:FemAB-related protein (PEP-CTERM system-associated)
MEIQLANNGERWNDFISQHTENIYATWEWGDICRQYGHKRYYIIATEREEIVGAIPLIHIDSALFNHKLVSVPFAEYGVVINPKNSSNVFENLFGYIKKLRVSTGADLIHMSGCNINSDEFVKKQDHVTFHIDLSQGYDSIWDQVQSNFRGDVRKARKNDVEVLQGDSVDDLRAYYELYLNTMKGHGTPPHSFDFIKNMWGKFDRNRFRLYLAKKSGKVINGRIVLQFNGKLVDRMSVADMEYRSLNGGSLLLWEAIRQGCEEGRDHYDLGRTRPDSGVYNYKKKLRGDKIGITDSYYSPGDELNIPDPQTSKYKNLQKIWKKLPNSLIRVIGPKIRKKIDI